MFVFISDTLYLFNIMLTFCTAVLLDEDTDTWELDHLKLAERYIFHGSFLKDVILIFPFG